MNSDNITIKLKKYTYTFERVPRTDERVGGCYGCWFCKKDRNGYYRQTCGDHKYIIGDCRKKSILKLIKKEL